MNIESSISPVNSTELLAKVVQKTALPTENLAPIKAKTLSGYQVAIEKTLIEKVKEVVSPILKAGISAFLYWINPSLFAIGFIGGIIFDEPIRNAIQKIKSVWRNQEVAGCLIGSFASALSLPVSLAAASLLWSAHFGALMHPCADERIQTLPVT